MRELRQNWCDLFYGFRIALDPKKMMLGFLGILLSALILIGLAYAFKGVLPNGAGRVMNLIRNPGLHAPLVMLEGARGLVLTGGPGLSTTTINGWGIVFLLVYALLMLAVWSFVGGATMRIAAVEFARDDRIDMSEATGFAKKKYLSFFGGPIVPLIGIIVFAVCLLVGGAIGRIPFIGPVLVGLLFFLAVLAGFLIVFIAIGGLFGVPLMFATVAMEGTDTFDAVSRAYSYIFGRPWRLIWYSLVAAAYGLVVTAFVLIFTSAMIAAPIYIGGWAMGANFDQIKAFLVNPAWAFPAEAGLGVKIGGVLVKLTLIVVWGLALGFIASYKATAMTIIYGLLRKDVDGTDMTEVFLEEEQEEEFEVPEPESEQEAGEEPAAEETPPGPAAEEPADRPAEEGEEEEKKEEGGSGEG